MLPPTSRDNARRVDPLNSFRLSTDLWILTAVPIDRSIPIYLNLLQVDKDNDYFLSLFTVCLFLNFSFLILLDNTFD